MASGVQILGERLVELADATAEARGPMRLPDVDLTSPAHQELKCDSDWGDPATIAQPMSEVLAYLELLTYAADDHLRSLGTLLRDDSTSWFGYIAVTRAAVETSCQIWHIADGSIDPLERVARYLLERQYELAHHGTLLGGAFKTLPQTVFDMSKNHADTQRKKLVSWASQAGLPTASGRIQGSRPGPMDLLVEVYEADEAALAAAGAAAAVAAYRYHELSAVAHGLPSGVALYLKSASTPGGHAHNVLAPSDVAHTAMAALVAHGAGFDRLARYFRWPHADLVPIRWAAIKAATALFT